MKLIEEIKNLFVGMCAFILFVLLCLVTIWLMTKQFFIFVIAGIGFFIISYIMGKQIRGKK